MASLIVLTGASRGIGRASAIRLARPGHHLALLGRDEDALRGVADDVVRRGAEASVHPSDLREDADVDRAAAAVLAIGVPEVVVLNAGRSNSLRIDQQADRLDVAPSTMGVNHLGQVRLVLRLLPAMAARGSGTLVGVTTANARIPVPGWSAYAASKAAFDAWLRAVRPELAALGISTTIVAFPLVDTDMIRPVYGHPKRAMSPDDAAAWIERAIDRRPTRIAPWWVPVAEVATAIAPTASARLIAMWSVRR